MTLTPSRSAEHRLAGLSLSELLCILALLGLLAGVVVPRVCCGAGPDRAERLDLALQRVRAQLDLYQEQHAGRWPAMATFVQQMTMATNEQGQAAAVGTPGFKRGPYLRDVPANPFTGGRRIGDGPIGSSDWFYNQNSGEFRANDSPDHRLL